MPWIHSPVQRWMTNIGFPITNVRKFIKLWSEDSDGEVSKLLVQFTWTRHVLTSSQRTAQCTTVWLTSSKLTVSCHMNMTREGTNDLADWLVSLGAHITSAGIGNVTMSLTADNDPWGEKWYIWLLRIPDGNFQKCDSVSSWTALFRMRIAWNYQKRNKREKATKRPTNQKTRGAGRDRWASAKDMSRVYIAHPTTAKSLNYV